MKKIILIILTTLLLLIPMETVQADITYYSDGLISVTGNVTRIRTSQAGHKTVYVLCDSGKWRGHVFTITIHKFDWNNWIIEQGAVKYNTAVKLLMDSQNTEYIEDDIILNIRK